MPRDLDAPDGEAPFNDDDIDNHIPVGTGVARAEGADILEHLSLIAENLGGAPLTPALLPKITVPSGNGRSFDVPTLDGIRPTSTLELIVLAASKGRAFWEDAYGDGDKLPTCSSANGLIGVGSPGGVCVNCPLSAFGTATGPKGEVRKGQACREFRVLLGTTEEGSLVIFRVPPSSVLEWDRYALALATNGYPLAGVVTAVELEQAVNDGGIQYAKAVFRKVGEVEGTTTTALRSMARTFAGKDGSQLALGSVLATSTAIEAAVA